MPDQPELNYTDTGEMALAECDDANVPVNSHLCAPDDDCPRWHWFADNFMPRKCMVADSRYRIEADSKEVIMEAVKRHVVPLYEAALTNLKAHGRNYYWEVKS